MSFKIINVIHRLSKADFDSCYNWNSLDLNLIKMKNKKSFPHFFLALAVAVLMVGGFFALPNLAEAQTGPTCSMIWTAPRLIDGKGYRVAGETANVWVNLTGFTPGTQLRLRNNGPTVNGTPVLNIGSAITIGASGSYSYTDQTTISPSEYPAGFYNTWIVDENNQRSNTALASCDYGFLVISSF